MIGREANSMLRELWAAEKRSHLFLFLLLAVIQMSLCIREKFHRLNDQ